MHLLTLNAEGAYGARIKSGINIMVNVLRRYYSIVVLCLNLSTYKYAPPCIQAAGRHTDYRKISPIDLWTIKILKTQETISTPMPLPAIG